MSAATSARISVANDSNKSGKAAVVVIGACTGNPSPRLPPNTMTITAFACAASRTIVHIRRTYRADCHCVVPGYSHVSTVQRRRHLVAASGTAQAAASRAPPSTWQRRNVGGRLVENEAARDKAPGIIRRVFVHRPNVHWLVRALVAAFDQLPHERRIVQTVGQIKNAAAPGAHNVLRCAAARAIVKRSAVAKRTLSDFEACQFGVG